MHGRHVFQGHHYKGQEAEYKTISLLSVFPNLLPFYCSNRSLEMGGKTAAVLLPYYVTLAVPPPHKLNLKEAFVKGINEHCWQITPLSCFSLPLLCYKVWNRHWLTKVCSAQATHTHMPTPSLQLDSVLHSPDIHIPHTRLLIAFLHMSKLPHAQIVIYTHTPLTPRHTACHACQAAYPSVTHTSPLCGVRDKSTDIHLIAPHTH